MNRLSLRSNPLAEVQDVFRKVTNDFKGICRICLKLIKINQKTTISNGSDLETLGPQVVMRQNHPGHCVSGVTGAL